MSNSISQYLLADPNWKEIRVRAYKEDGVLAMFREMLFRVYSYATPIIKVCVDNPQDSIFDIDAKSKATIEQIKEKMKEYIQINYSDIINVDKLEL